MTILNNWSLHHFLDLTQNLAISFVIFETKSETVQLPLDFIY